MIWNYYNFWDYWQLYHKVTFDGVNKLILINEGVTSIDVQTDIYSDWKEWVKIYDNIKYEAALSTVGGEPTIEGQRLDVTYFLINGWKIKPFPGSYTLNLVGNIFTDTGDDIKVDADVIEGQPNNIAINTNTSVIVRQLDSTSSGTSGFTEDDRTVLYNVEDKVIAIESLLQSPITATLETTQAAQLTDIQNKLLEIWKIHGLDINNPLVVTQSGRTVDLIDQTIVTTGENETQETTITRN